MIFMNTVLIGLSQIQDTLYKSKCEYVFYYLQNNSACKELIGHFTRVGVNSIPELELLVNSNSNSGIGIGIGIEIGGIENGIGIENPGIGIGIGIENRNWFFAMATAALTN